MRYRPDVVGTHRIYLNVNGQDLPGGPIETEVNQAQEVTETVAVTSQYEEGLPSFLFSVVRKICKFEKLAKELLFWQNLHKQIDARKIKLFRYLEKSK